MPCFAQNGCIKTHLISIHSCREGTLTCLCLAGALPRLEQAMQATRTCPWLVPQLIPWLRKARPECLTSVSLVTHYQVCWRHLYCTLVDYY